MMGIPPPASVLLLFALAAQAAAKTPCLNYDDVNPKSYVTYKSKNYPLVLGVSERLTHRLTTAVFKIFLSEVLGYPDVEILPMAEANRTAQIISQFYNEHVDAPPSFMVDLEGWVPLNENTIHDLEDFKVRECGNVGPPARFGWFAPSDVLSQRLNKSFILYETFKDPLIAPAFSPLKEDMAALGYRYQKYEPEWCKGVYECATLFASTRGATQFVEEDIEKMRLYVRVIWLGENFRPQVTKLLAKYDVNADIRRSGRLVLILGQSLELLPFHKTFTPVIFPVCNYYGQSLGCNYVGQRLVKLAWEELITAATSAYEALQKVEFIPSDYQELVDTFLKKEAEKDPDPVFNTACTWMKKHRTNANSTWTWWKPADEVELSIIGIFPLSRRVFSPHGIFTGAQMAIDEINHSELLSNYKLKLLLEDGQCRADVVMRTFITYIVTQFRKIVGILGPACSETVEPLAGVATHFETVVISYSAEGSSFEDRVKYPYFFRTIGENRQYQFVYQALFERMNWKRVAAISEDGTKYTEYISATQELLSPHVSFIANKKFSQAALNDPEKMREYLKEFKLKEARIIIADVNEAAAKTLMCEAYHMNMTAKNGFVWFLPSWLKPFWMEESALFYNVTSNGRNLFCTTHQMKEAIDAHLSLTHAFYAPDNETIHTNKTVKQWKEEYESNLKRISANASDYAGYAYDAVWVYAMALDALIKENQTYISNLHSKNVTEKYVSYIQNTNFSGVSGLIEFKDGPSRNTTQVLIFQWNSFSKDQHRVEVGHYDPKAVGGKKFELNDKLRWLTEGQKIPWDGTVEGTCLFDWLAKSLNSSCETAYLVANIFGLGLICLIVLIVILVIRHQYDAKVKLTQKYMKSLGFDLVDVDSANHLDEWEIPKDRVVINRSLGSGAFGMVYGGEAYFDGKGWEAVAVKTLKVGSTAEEKLDFLGEAEVMKRFNHKNIVQLLGVCTKQGTIYTVMEFMLYGDLKTFLLARRHLVNDGTQEDSDEISSKRLTNMALDVARALGYLEEQKYVHRDVASRNCLVNVSRVVKLGDFGMTRPMCDNDYYRFNRKGMLPVRWMAPESLVMGVFTPASDIWSFGVLLYEIITFGNFPFQGMSNNEVLEYVKRGNTLTIPTGIEQNLENLIKSCWHNHPDGRPRAAEIVEFLANSPTIISPCIDSVPTLSVPHSDDNTFGMFSEGRTRKFSMTVRQRTPSSPQNEGRPCGDLSDPLLPLPNGQRPVNANSTISEDAPGMSNHGSGQGSNFSL